MELTTFAENLKQEIIVEAQLEGAEALRPDVFTRRLIQELTDAGELDDGEVTHFRERGLGVSGYSVSDDGTQLDLLFSIYTQAVPPGTVGRSDVENAFRLLLNFFDRAQNDLARSMEESTPAFDLATTIQGMDKLEHLRLFVLTDGLTTIKEKPDEIRDGLRISFNVWDLKRLFQCVTSGDRQESIDIDFVTQFGRAIPCLVAPHEWADYQAYLAIVPGSVLQAVYEEYGARLLERNVRAFLQLKGKVNQGIRKTILEQPDRFLAYNNGISATASSVDVVAINEGGLGIAKVSDLQIVNGGQTTASIHHVVRRDKADISHIFVQAKITAVPPEKLNEIVPKISRFANSQNKVSEADFEANDPFHVAVENWSRTVWAPAASGSQQQTRWFYERARGQYQDAAAKEATPARIRLFKMVHPTNQKFTKTDLAKFENCWDQLPHTVSLGAEKSFRHFTMRLSNRGKFAVAQQYFERLIAKAILFRRTERIVAQQNFGGYRANTVAYTVSFLAHATSQRINLDKIWREQDVSPALADAIEGICQVVRPILVNAPGNRNVTEWCKKSACWEAVRELEVGVPGALRAELIDLDYDAWRATERVGDVLLKAAGPLGKSEILERSGIPERYWGMTIRTLLAQGKVVQKGSKRGATYLLATEE